MNLGEGGSHRRSHQRARLLVTDKAQQIMMMVKNLLYVVPHLYDKAIQVLYDLIKSCNAGWYAGTALHNAWHAGAA